MVQTNLKSDDFCGYNTAAASSHWILDPIQNNIQFNIGEVGLSTGVGIHIPSEVIKVSNFLSDRGNYLTKCVPPVPTMSNKTINEYEDNNTVDMVENFNDTKKVLKADGTMSMNNNNSTDFLLSEYTRRKGAAKDYSAVNLQGGFLGNHENALTHHQNLNHVIERMWVERGGLDQNQMIKQSYYYDKNPVDLNNNVQEKTCDKIRKPYDIKFPFGLPVNPINGENIPVKESTHFNAIDAESIGISSPQFGQYLNLPFNYNAPYSNGGCNQVSFLKNSSECN